MWHSLLLGKWDELFYWLPIEELIRSRQQDYHDLLGLMRDYVFIMIDLIYFEKNKCFYGLLNLSLPMIFYFRQVDL